MDVVSDSTLASVGAPPQVVLSVRDLSYRHNSGETILSNISFDAHAGEHLVIVGPSGCGKTTLLKCLSGRLAPQTGNIAKTGRTATIHQDLRLVGERSAFVNVLHGSLRESSLVSSVCGFSRAQRKKALDLLERVGLGHRVRYPVKKLSGGEKQRVAIARALMQEPAILMADEPVSGLDDFNSHSILRLLKELSHERQMTVILVLHNRAMAAVYGDSVLNLVGKSVKCAVPRDFSSGSSEEKRADAFAHSHIPLSEPPRTISSTLIVALAVLFGALGIQSTSLLEGVRSELLWSNVTTLLGQLVPTSMAELREIPFLLLLESLWETVRIALLATALSAIVSIPLAVLSARNIGNRYISTSVRCLLNAVRTIPAIVWALLCVAALGLGPLAGVCALTAYSTGYLTKFFYEVLENVDPKPVSALRELGASSAAAFVHAIWPAAKPALITSVIFMAEYNVRSASILGIVGAGGIGFYIKEYIDYRFFPAMTTALVMILMVVLALDCASGIIRRHLVKE